MDSIKEDAKLKELKDYFLKLGSVAVAFSAGVDSTFLLKTAHDVLGEKCIAITGRSPSFPRREQKQADEFCADNGIRQVFFDTMELEDENYSSNPKNRCYFCKKILFSKMKSIAKSEGINYVAEGSNLDDMSDYRPGLKAIEELEIKSPLRELGFTKEMIRQYSRQMSLPTWNKQSFACLASRFVYGESITKEGLGQVEKAEDYLASLGLRQYRVRKHSDLARIEVAPEDIVRLTAPDIRDGIVKALKSYGFKYVTIDLGGYRMGSMNEAIDK